MAEDKFKPTDGGKVAKTKADEWIKLYDDEHRHDKGKDTKSIFFGKDFLQTIINTHGSVGVSFFFAKKHNEHAGKPVLDLVLVPTAADGTLIWPEGTEGKDSRTQQAYDNGKPCPPYCP